MALWENPAAQNGVHVLIIGVGEYESDRIEALSGAAYSAARIGYWWGEAADKLLPGEEFGSIQLLVASPVSLIVKMPDGSYLEPGRPTRAAIVEAFDIWLQKSRLGGRAVVHWIGHAVTIGDRDPPIAHNLYCYDWDRETDAPHTIDWLQTLPVIDRELGDRALCFIDTCRIVPPKSDHLPISSGVWQRGHYPGVRASFVYYSVANGNHAYCLDAQDRLDHYSAGRNAGSWFSDRGRFTGGALFSEALLCAFDGFGAIDRDTEYRASVYEDRIDEVVAHRIEIWKKFHAILHGHEQRPVRDVPTLWLDQALFLAPRPTSHVVASLADRKAFAQWSFRFQVSDGQHSAPYASEDGWQVDVDQGDHEAIAVAESGDRDGARRFTERFRAVHLIHKVRMKEVTE